MVNKHIGSAFVRSDETKALFRAEPFYCTCIHYLISLLNEPCVYRVEKQIATEIFKNIQRNAGGQNHVNHSIDSIGFENVDPTHAAAGSTGPGVVASGQQYFSLSGVDASGNSPPNFLRWIYLRDISVHLAYKGILFCIDLA
ncbi:MAG: hypothetical protein KJN67_01785, partial [Pontiella sp.]|nr:hypothetical protein [Pontiella sp.]